jgi:hypothetical protein
MPTNDNIKIKCSKLDCYWNIDDDKEQFDSNCACESIILTDKECKQHIEKTEAAKRKINPIIKISTE